MALLTLLRRFGRGNDRRWPLSFRPSGALLVLLLLIAAPGVARTQEVSREYQIKAAFLFNFAKFVKWPPASFPSPNAPFCIGLLGQDPFGAALNDTVQGETIDGRRLSIRRGQTVDELKDCQMIFISKSEEGHVGEILSQLDSKPILVVSEIDGFAQNGGEIDFFIESGKVRFEINPGSARRVGLNISSQLLSLGKIVRR